MTTTDNSSATVSSEPLNTVELVSTESSKITNVSLYTGRAEVTRLYRFEVKKGQNQVHIKGLPSVLDQPSLRVEGRGAATIHDVSISMLPASEQPSVSSALVELLEEQSFVNSAIERNRKVASTLDTYLGTMNMQNVDPSKLADIIHSFDSSSEAVHKKGVELNKRLRDLEEKIKEERSKTNVDPENSALRLKATVGVFAEQEGEIEIVLIYAVSRATWEAAYDVRVDTHATEAPVTLIYKAIITQSTGEAWDEVPLNLETATPSFGINLPTLTPWKLAITKQSSPQPFALSPDNINTTLPPRPVARISRSTYSISEEHSSQDDEDYFSREMKPLGMNVHSKGGVSATFSIPGVVTLPSDGERHNFTIVELKLDASMSWVAIPKRDQRVHLKASVKNESEYTLLAGQASVYVDGSFIARSNIPAVSPHGSFDCPLGLDPSIHITYQPLQKKSSTTGFMGKYSNYVFTQRITVHNTKTTAIDNLKICDQIPVSEDSQITVKLTNPPLESTVSAPLPPTATADSNPGPWHNKGRARASTLLTANGTLFPSEVAVGDGVVARWNGAEEDEVDLEALGKDGKMYWLCEVSPGAKVNLVLSWEVNTPIKAPVTGL